MILNPNQRDSLDSSGYVVVPELVPEHLLSAARDAICAFVNADLARPETWYRHEPLDWSIVPIHHAQAFWDIRQWPAVHETFSSLLATEKLWVTMDRAVFKVPQSSAHHDHVDESVLHWDLDPRAPHGYQGMLFLTDATVGEGCFECVPSIFRNLEPYLESHPDPPLEAPVDVGEHATIEVPARAGDLVIWNSRLPHHGGPNRGARPRLSLALTMHREGSEPERRARIACWQQKRPPKWWRGVKGQLDPEPGAPATLTALGRRLVGVDQWP